MLYRVSSLNILTYAGERLKQYSFSAFFASYITVNEFVPFVFLPVVDTSRDHSLFNIKHVVKYQLQILRFMFFIDSIGKLGILD